MNNKELQDLLKNYPDDMEVQISHPEGDWKMNPVDVGKYEDEEFVNIGTEFSDYD